jgi:hypothetical protein
MPSVRVREANLDYVNVHKCLDHAATSEKRRESGAGGLDPDSLLYVASTESVEQKSNSIKIGDAAYSHDEEVRIFVVMVPEVRRTVACLRG